MMSGGVPLFAFSSPCHAGSSAVFRRAGHYCGMEATEALEGAQRHLARQTDTFLRCLAWVRNREIMKSGKTSGTASSASEPFKFDWLYRRSANNLQDGCCRTASNTAAGELKSCKRTG